MTIPTVQMQASSPHLLQLVGHPQALIMSEHPNPNDGRHHLLQIRQQNINKSLVGQLDLLMTLRKDHYDFCAIQEPYIDFNGKTRANHQWITIYPSTHSSAPKDTRSVILINANLPTNDWTQIPILHPDITAIEFSCASGKIRLFNIYNDCKNNIALTDVATYMKANPPQRSLIRPTHHIWLGDFNRHHPLWDEPRNAHLFTKHNLDLAQPLLNMLSKFRMKMALPPGIHTLRSHSTGNYTRVNNVFCNEDLLDTIIKCNTDDASRPIKTDHFPIITRLDIHTPTVVQAHRLNF